MIHAAAPLQAFLTSLLQDLQKWRQHFKQQQAATKALCSIRWPDPGPVSPEAV
jgi:hypothetical protein